MRAVSGERYRREIPHGLMFHRFHAASSLNGWQGALTPEEFERVLVYVGVDRILSPEDWMSRLECGGLRQHDVCVTFDDGLRCQAEFALPVLESYGLRAFWFIYSSVYEGHPVKAEIYSRAASLLGGMASLVADFLGRCPSEMLAQLESPEFGAYERRMREVAPFYSPDDVKYRFLRNRPGNRQSFEDIMDLILREHGCQAEDIGRHLWLSETDLRTLGENGHCVGLHSYDHPYEMSGLTREEQQQQYGRNREHLMAVTKKTPRCMSHPLNSYNDQSLAILNELGIRCGFRANMAPPPGKGLNPSSLELAREDATNLLSMIEKGPVTGGADISGRIPGHSTTRRHP